MDQQPGKRPSPPSDDYDPPRKKARRAEESQNYSWAVRKRMANNVRTGQACDRCKERKMRCDSDPIACRNCRQKYLRCFTTDRVTGHARERGESDRADNELAMLREQLTLYHQRYGPLHSSEQGGPVYTSSEGPASTCLIPDSYYVGWPAPQHSEPLHSGPVRGTVVDICGGLIDIADWDCEMMRDYPSDTLNKFNLSRTSIVNTISGFQRVEPPLWPSRDQALQSANHFLVIMSQYVPIVHRQSFMDLVHRFYDLPDSLSAAERVQVVMVFTIIAHQTGVRNHDNSADKFEKSHRYFHYALGHYRQILQDSSLSSMQAMALIVLHFRNLPKPGISWNYSHEVLVRAIELEYHRDPDKIRLPEAERDPLSKELRKRVFHSILGICVTTGCRVGLPAPWQFQHIDVPLPRPIKDTEISKVGLVPDLSGECDFWPCLHLAKLLPLLTELHNHIIAVRKPAMEYLQTVDALNTKILAWRQDWDDCIRHEPKHVNLAVATLLVETWAAEYQLNLHHPVCCTSDDHAVRERHLEICHKSAKRLLQAFHTLSKEYKGVDFTWHSTLAYATAFGVTIFTYKGRRAPVTLEQLNAMKNELKGWVSLMAYADLVLRTGNYLQRHFQPRVQALEDEYHRQIVLGAGKRARNHTPRLISVNGSTVPQHQQAEYEASHAYQASHNPPVNGNSLPPLPFMPVPMRSQSQPHSPSVNQQPQPGWSPLPYNNGFPAGAEGPGSALGPTSPIYPTFSRAQISAPLAPPPTQTIPTSLASLLNDTSSFYTSYSEPPQPQYALSGGDPLMAFSPGHYYDGPGPMGWPLISMPPGTHS